jgi:hypothetical protein
MHSTAARRLSDRLTWITPDQGSTWRSSAFGSVTSGCALHSRAAAMQSGLFPEARLRLIGLLQSIAFRKRLPEPCRRLPSLLRCRAPRRDERWSIV